MGNYRFLWRSWFACLFSFLTLNMQSQSNYMSIIYLEVLINGGKKAEAAFVLSFAEGQTRKFGLLPMAKRIKYLTRNF